MSEEQWIKNWLRKHPGLRRLAGSVLANVPPSIRLGKQFWFWYTLFQESENWTLSQMETYQLECLRKLLEDLKDSSPFYQKRLQDIDPNKIDSVKQFQSLIPALKREEFAANYDDIISRKWKNFKLTKARTSGTTGQALQFFHPLKDNQREWAAICYQWKRVGYVPGRTRRAEFRGLVQNKRLIDYFPEQKMLRCSILDLKEENVRYYADIIRRNGIEFFHGYPSALNLLALEIVNHKISFPQPKAVLLASEEVYDWQLDNIQTAFPNAILFAHYGCAERTVLAGWCEHRREYHVLPQYSLVEVNPDNSEIIGTNLFNTVNGFVRYRMTDTVLESDWQTCPDCKRPLVPRFKKLGGRSEDYLFSCEKGLIPPAVVTYPLKGLMAIQEIQFKQSERDVITMRYTTRIQATESEIQNDLKNIKKGLGHLFGRETSFLFERVDDFKRSPSGKFKWIVSELDESRLVSRSI